MVHVQQLADAVGEKLVVTVITRTTFGAKWSITVPASMTWLGGCQMDSIGSNAIPLDGMEVFREEMGFAAFGIGVVDARQREMLGIVP